MRFLVAVKVKGRRKTQAEEMNTAEEAQRRQVFVSSPPSGKSKGVIKLLTAPSGHGGP